MKQEVGALLHLYLDEISTGIDTQVHDFLIQGAAKAINDAENRNWIPLIVKQIGSESYQVIANSFVFAAAEEAGLTKVWCIVADDSPETQESARILTQEKLAKINLATATREEIKVGLDYLMKRPINPLKLGSVKLANAVERIENAPRQYWKENLMDVTKIKCGITRGKKLNIFKEIFYTTPEPLPDVIIDPQFLTTFTQAELQKMAKKRGLKGYSKLKKSALVKLLTEQG
ncbi:MULTISPECIES: Rho termination factor N-terminal domain-containing protein [Cyanophyceae]|uniref:Rho termination factor N-terminal domain-containing protein n=1 Tax=Cyanophyceae TaxID=3028117 RepID=UPI000745933D|nr:MULTISPECIES: Rho termination factor N-terminal domain-containing protein [Cyanophyceae]AMA08154.1 transcription termination factor rho family protein [Picosynechococcus sp. PCC 73109]